MLFRLNNNFTLVDTSTKGFSAPYQLSTALLLATLLTRSLHEAYLHLPSTGLVLLTLPLTART